jgi:hypothetical protein
VENFLTDNYWLVKKESVAWGQLLSHFDFILVIQTTALSEQSSILSFHDVTCHNLEASPHHSCPYSYYQKVQEYHNCYQHHVKEWCNKFVTDDADGWENMKTDFVLWNTVDAAGWENMKNDFVLWHTVDAAGWENMKNDCVMAHS